MLRRSSGQARAILGGATHDLGVLGTPEAHAGYAALIRAREKGGKQPLQKALTVVEADFTVSDLFARYQAFLDETGRYTKGGEPTSERAPRASGTGEVLSDDLRVAA